MGSYGETMETNLGLDTKSLIPFLLGIMMVLIILSGIITSRPKSIKSKADEQAAGSVSLSINPAAINLKIGQREKFDLYINSGNQPVDGFTIKLKFDKEKLRVISQKVNPPFEPVIDWVDKTNGFIYLGGVLPPRVDSPLTSRSFAVASFYVEGLSQTDATTENISYVENYNNFQVVSNGSSYRINTLGAKVCVDSTASSCPAFVCSKPEAPIIKYPLNDKKTTEPYLEVYFTAPNQGCFPKEYQASLYRGTEMVCRTDWKQITAPGTKLINLSEFKSTTSNSPQVCPELSFGEYTVKVQLKSETNMSELAQSNFTYTNEKFDKDHPGDRFIGTYGSTDVVIPTGYPRVNRRCISPTVFRDEYMQKGKNDFFFGDSVCVSWSFCYDSMKWRDYLPEKYQTFNGCVAYYYRKLREIAINFGQIKSMNIDDVVYISVDPLSMDYYEIVEAATGDRYGSFGVTYYSEDISSCPSFAKDVKFVYLYSRSKKNYSENFEKLKNCFSQAKMIVGLYARSMGVFFNYDVNNDEEIINSCNYAKAAKRLLDSKAAVGIEIYDGSSSDPTKDSYYELNQKIASLTSEILATGDSSYCH